MRNIKLIIGEKKNIKVQKEEDILFSLIKGSTHKIQTKRISDITKEILEEYRQ